MNGCAFQWCVLALLLTTMSCGDSDGSGVPGGSNYCTWSAVDSASPDELRAEGVCIISILEAHRIVFATPPSEPEVLQRERGTIGLNQIVQFDANGVPLPIVAPATFDQTNSGSGGDRTVTRDIEFGVWIVPAGCAPDPTTPECVVARAAYYCSADGGRVTTDAEGTFTIQIDEFSAEVIDGPGLVDPPAGPIRMTVDGRCPRFPTENDSNPPEGEATVTIRVAL